MASNRVDVVRGEPKHPDLAATLIVQPPRTYPEANPETDSYRAKRRDEWTLGNLERTCIELRAAGGWDDSKVTFGYRDGGSIECEILAGPGPDVLPWGWVPAHGATPAPAPTGKTYAQLAAAPARMLTAITTLLVVDLAARLIGWVF